MAPRAPQLAPTVPHGHPADETDEDEISGHTIGVPHYLIPRGSFVVRRSFVISLHSITLSLLTPHLVRGNVLQRTG